MEGDELQPRGLQRQAQGARAVEDEVVGELEAFGPCDGGQPARVDLCEAAGLDEEHSIGCLPAPLRRQLGDGLAQVGQHVAVGDHVEGPRARQGPVDLSGPFPGLSPVDAAGGPGLRDTAAVGLPRPPANAVAGPLERADGEPLGGRTGALPWRPPDPECVTRCVMIPLIEPESLLGKRRESPC